MSEQFPSSFTPVAEVDVGADAHIFEHGWQSFSPATAYRIDERPYRPTSERNRRLNYRHDSHPGADGFFSEGVLAVDDGLGQVHVVAADDPFTTGTRVRAQHAGGRLVVEADGPVTVASTPVDQLGGGSGAIQQALGQWAVGAAATSGVAAPRPAPTAWCSWYQYYGGVSEADITENLEAMADLELDVDVVQIDDGYEAEIGDWLTPSDRFADVRGVLDRIRGEGRRAGIWAAPFFAGARSRIAAEHPEWLLRHAHGGLIHAGHNWGQDLYSLDLTHPGAAEWIHTVFSTFAGWGADYIKIDFLAAGAIPGARYSGQSPVAAYRSGLELIRDAVGPDTHILGCGAPVLPSVGLVDSLRISPDTDAAVEPEDGDMSSPAQRAAIVTAQGRQFMNEVFFANDPDCLITRPAVEQREVWAQHVEDVAGAVVSSDRLRGLDDWGVQTTQRLLAQARARRG